jgi:hypothetical protein
MWAESNVYAAPRLAAAEQCLSQHRPDKTYGGQHDYRNRMQCVTLNHDLIAFVYDRTGESMKCKGSIVNPFRFDIRVVFQDTS